MKIRAAILFFVSGIVFGAASWEMLLQDKYTESNKNVINEEIIGQQNNEQPGESDEYRKQVVTLKSKVKELTEKLLIAQQNNNDEPVKKKRLKKVSALTENLLVEAGIDIATAQEIIRRKDEYEYRQLELRDRATREGFVGTVKFRKELNRLRQDDFNIRIELGDDVFDRYLYATGQSNRVKVSSIMQGSPAEYAGVKKGDVIISYGEKRIFSWHNLNKSTAKGQRDESVILNVKRNGEIFNISVQRGPLGVKLEGDRVLP